MTTGTAAPAPRLGRVVFLILAVGLIVQVFTAIHQTGWWHPDSHFGIMEFAGHKLGITPHDLLAREYDEKVRQTVPVYVFMGFHRVMQGLGIQDPYVEQTVLRLLTSLLNLLLFNAIILRTFRSDRKIILWSVLFVANLSWCMPYVRTLFCYENLGGLFYFGGILLYQVLRSRSITLWGGVLVGFVLGFAFFFRFQMGFALVGLGLWFLFVDRVPFRALVGLVGGFLIASGINVWLDSRFYGEFVVTPYLYFEINIIVGRATSIGTSSVLYYLAILATALTVPPLSGVLLYFAGWGMVRRLKDPYVLSTIFFLALHFIVGHKEERFLFPVFGILPVLMGYGLQAVFRDVPQDATRLKDLPTPWKWVVAPSLVLNAVVLVVLMFQPVCQQVEFARKLNAHFEGAGDVKVVCYGRTPYETPAARNVMVWYRHAQVPNVEMETVFRRDEFLALVEDPPPDTWFVATYRNLMDHGLYDEMPCRAELVGSAPLTTIAHWIHAWTGKAIPEVWGLYRCSPGSE